MAGEIVPNDSLVAVRYLLLGIWKRGLLPLPALAGGLIASHVFRSYAMEEPSLASCKSAGVRTRNSPRNWRSALFKRIYLLAVGIFLGISACPAIFAMARDGVRMDTSPITGRQATKRVEDR